MILTQFSLDRLYMCMVHKCEMEALLNNPEKQNSEKGNSERLKLSYRGDVNF